MDTDFQKPHGYFTLHAFDRHPGVSIVDIDGDGFDDIYVMARWGENLLLVNQGDGTYAERAAEFGLNIADHTAASLFADFDNDGDSDVFVGRTLEPSLYLVNENGRFVDRSDHIEGRLPHLVASIAAADYDSDGLLDVYFSTYAARMLLEAPNSTSVQPLAVGSLLDEFLPPPQAQKLYRLAGKKCRTSCATHRARPTACSKTGAASIRTSPAKARSRSASVKTASSTVRAESGD